MYKLRMSRSKWTHIVNIWDILGNIIQCLILNWKCQRQLCDHKYSEEKLNSYFQFYKFYDKFVLGQNEINLNADVWVFDLQKKLRPCLKGLEAFNVNICRGQICFNAFWMYQKCVRNFLWMWMLCGCAINFTLAVLNLPTNSIQSTSNFSLYFKLFKVNFKASIKQA